jgi:hypothetical protein
MFIREAEFVDDQTRDRFSLQVNLVIQSSLSARIGINLRLKDGMGFPVGIGCSHYFAPDLTQVNQGETRISLDTQPMNLAAGTYKLSVELVHPGVEVFDLAEDCIHFELSNDGIANRGYGVSQAWGFGANEIKISSIF